MASPLKNPEKFEKFEVDDITLYIEKQFLEKDEIEFLMPFVKNFKIIIER